MTTKKLEFFTVGDRVTWRGRYGRHFGTITRAVSDSYSRVYVKLDKGSYQWVRKSRLRRSANTLDSTAGATGGKPTQ
jgi:hypothetical protein